MSSQPLTPLCVRFRTRWFNNLSAIPCIFEVCYHIPLIQGIRLLMSYAKYDYWIFYTPEMNSIEQIWKEIILHGFRNEVFQTLNKVMDRLCDTISSLTASTIKSITARK